MPTEVANAGEHRTYKIFALDFPICLWARHKQMNRIFTIKRRTYQVCFKCGRVFDLPGPRCVR
jgi:hypothetical protein